MKKNHEIRSFWIDLKERNFSDETRKFFFFKIEIEHFLF